MHVYFFSHIIIRLHSVTLNSRVHQLYLPVHFYDHPFVNIPDIKFASASNYPPVHFYDHLSSYYSLQQIRVSIKLSIRTFLQSSLSCIFMTSNYRVHQIIYFYISTVIFSFVNIHDITLSCASNYLHLHFYCYLLIR